MDSLGKYLGGISARSEEFLEVTRSGRNSFYILFQEKEDMWIPT